MTIFRTLFAMLAALALLSGCDEPPEPTVNLYRAVHSGDLDQIKRHLFWKTEINQPGPDGDYPLHVAVRQGRVAIAGELIDHGARLDVRDRRERTPLQVALAHGKIQAAQLLLRRGAGEDPQALLFALARSGELDPDTIELLVSEGADLNARDAEGQTPLHRAIAAGDVKLAKRLISAGADVNQPDGAGDTPLARATANGDPNMVLLLEQYGAER